MFSVIPDTARKEPKDLLKFLISIIFIIPADESIHAAGTVCLPRKTDCLAGTRLNDPFDPYRVVPPHSEKENSR